MQFLVLKSLQHSTLPQTLLCGNTLGMFLLLLKSSQHNREVIGMTLLINEDYNKQIQKLSEHLIHKIHEGSRSIYHPKWHNQKLIVTRPSSEINLGNINLPNFN